MVCQFPKGLCEALVVPSYKVLIEALQKKNKTMIELSTQSLISSTVICRCLADQLFLSVFSISNYLICELLARNHDILLNILNNS